MGATFRTLDDYCCGSQVNSGLTRPDTIESCGDFMNDRKAAWNLLTEFTASENLRKHALAVEACMRAYARKFGEDENLWGVTGLGHDFDYEKYPTPEEHPFVGNKILEERGWPETIRRAVLSHAQYSGVPRVSNMEKTLFACDELAGLITAHAVR